MWNEFYLTLPLMFILEISNDMEARILLKLTKINIK